MTRAPANLLAARRLLLDYLDVDPGAVRAADLEPGEVGIVGDANHRGGYHCGSDRVDADDYSVDESPRDRAGLTLDASALDVGLFVVATPQGVFNLRHFSRWVVAQCVAGTADTRDIREVIYSPDGATVRRWDRLKKRGSGDSSHLTHTHFSFFRDATKAGRDQTPLFRRYLTTIGLIEGDDMLSAEDKALIAALHTDVRRILVGDLSPNPATGKPQNALLWWLRMLANNADPATLKAFPGWAPPGPGLAQLGQQLAALRADVTALAGRDVVDEPAIVEGVLAGLGRRPAADVARALVAAGQDPSALAAELTKLAATAPQG